MVGVMTTAEVKEFFRQIRKEQSEITHLSEMIERERASLLPQAIQYDKEHIQVSPENLFENSMVKLTDMDTRLRESIKALKYRKAQAEEMLFLLDNSDEREVMRWYYMDTKEGKLLKWDDVAKEMSYDTRHILRIHGSAIVNLANKSCH